MKSMSNPYGWSLAEKKGQYYLWSRMELDGTVWWNATIHDRPPQTDSGFTRTEIVNQCNGTMW